VQDEKPSISEPGPADPVELVRRYRVSGVRSGSRRKSRSHGSRSKLASSPVEKPASEHARHVSPEELRRREKDRSRKRNSRITGHRRRAAIRQLGINLGYLTLAGLIAYFILSGVLR
jgi:hypothetical protein